MPLYLLKFDNRPPFRWDMALLSPFLGDVRHRQGRLLGLMEILGPAEGARLANRLRGEECPEIIPILHEATRHFRNPLTEKKLSVWRRSICQHAGQDPGHEDFLSVGAHTQGMHQNRVHASSPNTSVPLAEMRKFISWFNQDSRIDPILKAGIAHLWFMLIHPNPCLAHLVTAILLCRADNHAQRFYSLYYMIDKEQGDYKIRLTQMQRMYPEPQRKHEAADITPWLEWYLSLLDRALRKTEQEIAQPLQQVRLQNRFGSAPLNERQQRVIRKLLEPADDPSPVLPGSPRISSSEWARLAGCSQDTALRDIQELMDRSILYKVAAGGRSTHYGFATGFGNNA